MHRRLVALSPTPPHSRPPLRPALQARLLSSWQVSRASAGLAVLVGAFAVSACSSPAPQSAAPTPSAYTIDVHLLAFNDLHGHLEPPGLQAAVPTAQGGTQGIATGGMAWLAGTVQQLRQQYPHSAVVSAGDMVGSSPLLSSLFLHEPTIEAANALQMDFAAVGNHEFDQGWPELLRLAHGGCRTDGQTVLQRAPCQVNPQFGGAQFPLLAANVHTAQGDTLLPATGLKTFGTPGQQVTIGFIGMTLRDTPKLVGNAATKGLHFADEAATANALVPQLLAQGADVIAVLLHEGGVTRTRPFDAGCTGLSGSIVPILEKLDPRISLVISGHTHQTYVCDYASVNPAKPFLLTSAGYYGTQLTDITLRWDASQKKLLHRSARTLAIPASAEAAATASPVIVPGTAPHAGVQQVIDRYAVHTQALAQRVVGRITTPGGAALSRAPAASGEVPLGNLIADAQVWAMSQPDMGGADISFMHSGGIRADLQPAADGSVRYEQLYAVQPFGNTLVGMTLSGAQIVALLEESYATPYSSSKRRRVLSPNADLRWRHDPQAPRGQQVRDVTLRGQPLQAQQPYRVVVSSFLAEGGDRYPVFGEGSHRTYGPSDIDALEAYVRAHSPLTAPRTDRIR